VRRDARSALLPDHDTASGGISWFPRRVLHLRNFSAAMSQCAQLEWSARP